MSSSVQTAEETESLLTRASLKLSLAPPRAPPYHTAHRSLYTNKDPLSATALHHHQHYKHYNRAKDLHPKQKKHHEIVHEYLSKFHFNKIPHPHLSFSPESADQLTRIISTYILPLHLQNKYRDNGTFRSISDNVVTMSVPSLALVHPEAVKHFIALSSSSPPTSSSFSINILNIPYGNAHPSQKVDIFLPPPKTQKKDIKGLVFFVHGGAWGSGLPWMYRLVASRFIAQNIAVAIVGYRTYPDGDVQDQVDDLTEAAKMIQMKYPFLWKRRRGRKKEEKNNSNHDSTGSDSNNRQNDDHIGVCLMGHSSGSHIGMLLLVQQIEKKLKSKQNQNQRREKNEIIYFDTFVGLSGVYNIQHHFDYEAGRGVEEISPMKPACGHTRAAFDHYSPAVRLHSLLRTCCSSSGSNKQDMNTTDLFMSSVIPPMLLLHGVDDDVVPFTSTSEAARIIRNCGARYCSEYYLSNTGHVDVIMHFMLGNGRSFDVVMKWLKDINNLLDDMSYSDNDGGSGSSCIQQAKVELSSKM